MCYDLGLPTQPLKSKDVCAFALSNSVFSCRFTTDSVLTYVQEMLYKEVTAVIQNQSLLPFINHDHMSFCDIFSIHFSRCCNIFLSAFI